MNSNISPVMQELSAYVAATTRRSLPPHVSERVRLQLIDTFAAMISGSRLLPGKKAIRYVRELGSKSEASVIATDMTASAANAALANGMFAHADETDDTHPPSLSHPGSSIVPAALAIGERGRLSGTALLRAIVLGYDVCSRLLLSLNPLQFHHSGHQAGAFGQTFGAAATAAALLKLDARKVRILFSYAANQAAGLYTIHRDTQHVEKAFVNGGMPAHNGVASGLMVASGFTGVEDVFSGELDFFVTFAPGADRHELVRGLGRDYEILRGGTKRWSVGGPIQGPLHVLNDLIKAHGFRADEVAKLVVRGPDKELSVVSDRDMPDICLQHLLAVMLVDGDLTFKASHDFRRMKDAKVLAARKRIETIGDASLTDIERRWRCVMEVHLKDGQVLHHQTMAAKGSYDNPLTRAEQEEKAMQLIAPVLGRARAATLVANLWNFERIKDVRQIRKMWSLRKP